MNKILLIIIAVLILLLAISILTRPQKETTDLRPFQEKEAKATATIKTLEAKYDSLAKRRAVDRQVFNNTVEEQSVTIKKQSALITRLKSKPEVIEVLNQNPEIDSLVTAMDIVNRTQAEQIETYALRVNQLEQDQQKIVENFQERLRNDQEILDARQGQIDVLKKEVKKNGRAVKWLKVGIVVLPILALIGGSQL